jgi:hypothetical protein
LQLWRDWLTQSERQFNAFLNEVMGSDAFSRGAGNYMELFVGFQRVVSQSMERYLNFVNMPSRTDIVNLGETLRAIEARLSRIEETLLIAAAAVDGGERGEARTHEPARTRRPSGAPYREEAPVGVPDDFRL